MQGSIFWGGGCVVRILMPESTTEELLLGPQFIWRPRHFGLFQAWMSFQTAQVHSTMDPKPYTPNLWTLGSAVIHRLSAHKRAEEEYIEGPPLSP